MDYKLTYWYSVFDIFQKAVFFSTNYAIANYAKIDRVGRLETGYNEFHLFNFSEFFTILLGNISNKNSSEKSKQIFS